jgi:hypothetical protein
LKALYSHLLIGHGAREKVPEGRVFDELAGIWAEHLIGKNPQTEEIHYHIRSM